ncbi:hypothetical protein CL619_01400 [archaeon]|nr:hypothetical protein [archaeon]|tara:strand:- start:2078 stop:2419 length:342 start_codon:yes stop_codon:yes gene_type:complete
MKLQPSLKPKKRYVLFQITPESKEKKFWKREVIDAIEEQLINCFGIFMFAKASPMVVKDSFDESTQQIIIKVSHKYTDELKVAMALIKEIKETPVTIQSISTSGILKKLKAKM